MFTLPKHITETEVFKLVSGKLNEQHKKLSDELVREVFGMPKDFTKCVSEGGKTRTVVPKAGKYIHVCKDKSGKWHSGEVKTKKK